MGGEGKRKRTDGGRLDWTKKVTGHGRVFAVVGLAGVVRTALTFGVLHSVRLASTEAKALVEMYKNPECNLL